MKRIAYVILTFFLTFTFFVGGCGAETPESSSSTQSSSSENIKYGLLLRKSEYSIVEGESVVLSVKFSANNEKADWSLLTFESADKSVAVVGEDGTVTGVSAGTTKITVSHENKKVEATVTVIAANKRVALSQDNVELLKGGNATITATAYVENEKDETATFVWSTENPSVAMVENGVITAVSEGETTISVAYGNITKKVNVFVARIITQANVNSFDEDYINIYGRTYITNNNLNLDHGASAVELGIVGTSLSVNITATKKSYLRVFTDNDTEGDRIQVLSGTKTYTVAQNLTDGYHKIRIVKATEEQQVSWDISGFVSTAFATVPKKSDFKIEFIGDSITAGYGNLGVSGEKWSLDNSDSAKTYAYFASQELNANYSIVAYSGICTKAYHWASDLNMATYYTYFSKTNKQEYTFDFKPNVIVLNLGTNEASYIGKAAGANYGSIFPIDYQEFLSYLRSKNPDAYIICLYGMMGTSNTIKNGIATAVNKMADSKIVFNPFEFEMNNIGAAGHPSLEAQKTWGRDLAQYIQGLSL